MGRRFPVLLVVVVVSLVPLAQMGGSDGRGEDRGPGPLDASDIWTDPLDDASHVYMRTDVEIASGEARLAPGKDQGWIASEAIPARAGYRYDFVILDAVTPGNSSVEISLLDANDESSEVGYANETISTFKRVAGTFLSVHSVAPSMYPEVRIQVNLNADGADRPALLAWSLHYIPEDEWRDDFLTDRKMSGQRGLNLTDGTLEVNLTSKSSGGPGTDYDPFPAVAGVQSSTTMGVCYANSAGTDYQDMETFQSGSVYSCAWGDFDNDGDMDLLKGSQPSANSNIFWTQADGKLSTSGKIDFTTDTVWDVTTGDYNGDGWTDFAMGLQSGQKCSIWLNEGDGSFTNSPNIVTSVDGRWADSGDINNDGYDDLLFSTTSSFFVFFGGEDGPDTTVDIVKSSVANLGARLRDVDLDGNLDIITWADEMNVFLGGPDGPPSNPISDVTISNTDTNGRGDVGDINGDGYIDIATPIAGGKVRIYKGSASGWSSSDYHEFNVDGTDHLLVADVDKDGYDDIVNPNDNYKLGVYLGGESWPTTRDIVKQGVMARGSIAVPRGASATRTYRGSFTTELIERPAQGKKWDILSLEGTFPKNTSLSMDILDGSGKAISGCSDISGMNVDLSELLSDNYPSIMVRVTIFSEFNTTTPVLDRIMVKWMDKMTWRDQFYSEVRMARLLGVDVTGGHLEADPVAWTSQQLVFASLRSDTGFDQPSQAYFDAGGLQYASRPPVEFATKGAAALDIADVNGDGFPDFAFAVHRTSDTNFAATSPLFLSSAMGWGSKPDHGFPTTGAMDVLLEDLNDDGYFDVVFAQEQDGGDYIVNSTLFWGSASGWNATPDVEFTTTGASDVEAADIDGDGDLDLVFACFRATSTSTDSMVFLQGPSGFVGSTASYSLATRGARAVVVGDLDGDSRLDLVFANSFSGGLSEIDSYIYWGKAGGGFETAPDGIPTVGAADVKAADVDGDGDLDLVFANAVDNSGSRHVYSYVYLNDGSGGFGTSPASSLPTIGASAVSVCDLDGTGRKDLVFACENNGTSYATPSMVYLGGASGWASSPDIVLTTEGAADVMVAKLVKAGTGGYMSKPITVEDVRDTGSFHTFRYDAVLGTQQSVQVQLIDAVTFEVLAETTMTTGSNEWVVKDSFTVRDHPSVRVVLVAGGLDKAGAFEVDNLWLNWTKRVLTPPRVVSLSVSEPSVLRLQKVVLRIEVEDDYDLPRDLMLNVEHRANGSTSWMRYLVGTSTFDEKEGAWFVMLSPNAGAAVGVYDFRVDVTDTDMQYVDNVEFPAVLEVMNNIPTAPVVHIVPADASTTSQLRVEFDSRSTDLETSGLEYIYRWYRDGELVTDLTGDIVPSVNTSKGQNWSVEVSSWDGDDESPRALAMVLIGNAAPVKDLDLPDPEIVEDTIDSDWLDLSTAFRDDDGDPLTWSLATEVDHMEVIIDPVTGWVTLIPEHDWFGQVDLTFVASDGEDTARQTVMVTVTPVNDIPTILTVDGKPVTSDPVVYTIRQGDLLVITYSVADAEDDDLLVSVNSSIVVHDEGARTITFSPGNDEVGTLRFGLWLSDNPGDPRQVTLNFIVVVENENDPMDDPEITSPRNNDKFKVNQSFSLIAICDDPDVKFGQELNFSWSSNMSGLLGHGRSLSMRLQDAGVHVITLTVTDGEFQRTTTVTVEIEPIEDITPPPPPDGEDEEGGLNYGLLGVGIVLALVVVGAVLYVTSTRRKAEELETADEEDYKREHMERAYQAVKDAVEHLEKGAEPPAAREAPGDEVAIEATGTPSMALTMEARETEAASAATMALFGAAAEPALSEEEQEQLRLDNLKRKYQNAIGRLPYGIPSPELKERDWVDLANALATGEKKTTPGGRELTEIDGRWYYSDVKDTGTFLKEHGAKPKREEPKPEERKVEVTTDKATLLAKLEERFILGEISEEAYIKLREKYESDDD